MRDPLAAAPAVPEPEPLSLLEAVTARRPAWMANGACRPHPPEWFFSTGRGWNAQRGREVCAACPVRPQCLAYAVEHGLRGVWGGTIDRERRALE